MPTFMVSHFLTGSGKIEGMNTSTTYPHLTQDAKGRMRIGQTRYRVIDLAAEHYQHGWSSEEMLRQHPDLRPQEVYAALTYIYDHYGELVAELNQSFQTAEQARPLQSVSREELLRRLKAQDSRE